jgi:hypothetical protein
MKNKILIFLGVLFAIVVLVFATKETKTVYSVTTSIKLKQPKLSLGKIKTDSLVTITIPLKNTGNNPLLISKVEKSSKSIVIDATAQYYPIHKPIELKLLFQPNKTGKINEQIIVHGNFPEQQIVIPILGEVIN